MSLNRRQNRTKNMSRNTKESSERMALIAQRVFNRRVEKKVYSVSAVGTSVVTTGNVINITNGIVEGDDISNRSGTVIRLVRLRVLYRGTAVTTSASVRYILFRDMLNQGSTPAASDLLPAGNWISQYADTREMQQNRFHIVHDLTFDLSIAGENVRTRTFDIPIQGNVYYNGPTGIASANGRGALFLLVIGNAITTTYDYTVQTVFTDA